MKWSLIVSLLFILNSNPVNSMASVHKTCIVKSSKGPPQCRVIKKDPNVKKLKKDEVLKEDQKNKIEKCDSLKSCGIKIYKETTKNNPVCAACDVCPSWQKDDFYIIKKLDIEKALELGFEETTMENCEKNREE